MLVLRVEQRVDAGPLVDLLLPGPLLPPLRVALQDEHLVNEGPAGLWKRPRTGSEPGPEAHGGHVAGGPSGIAASASSSLLPAGLQKAHGSRDATHRRQGTGSLKKAEGVASGQRSSRRPWRRGGPSSSGGARPQRSAPLGRTPARCSRRPLAAHARPPCRRTAHCCAPFAPPLRGPSLPGPPPFRARLDPVTPFQPHLPGTASLPTPPTPFPATLHFTALDTAGFNSFFLCRPAPCGAPGGEGAVPATPAELHQDVSGIEQWSPVTRGPHREEVCGLLHTPPHSGSCSWRGLAQAPRGCSRSDGKGKRHREAEMPGALLRHVTSMPLPLRGRTRCSSRGRRGEGEAVGCRATRLRALPPPVPRLRASRAAGRAPALPPAHPVSRH